MIDVIMYVLLGILIGYFIGVVSSLFQIIRMETRENKKIKEILDDV